jgi:hypothetical protein
MFQLAQLRLDPTLQNQNRQNDNSENIKRNYCQTRRNCVREDTKQMCNIQAINEMIAREQWEVHISHTKNKMIIRIRALETCSSSCHGQVKGDW